MIHFNRHRTQNIVISIGPGKGFYNDVLDKFLICLIYRGEAQGKLSKKIQTKGTLKKKVEELRKKVKGLAQEAANCDGEINKLQVLLDSVNGAMFVYGILFIPSDSSEISFWGHLSWKLAGYKQP